MKNESTNKAQKLTCLHVTVDTNTHEIIATELSLSTVTNGEVLPNLLEQTHRGILVMSGDGVYDMRAWSPSNHAMGYQELDG